MMPVLRHKGTGVLVTVSDERAGRLGSEWVADEVKPAPAPRRRKPTPEAENPSDD